LKDRSVSVCRYRHQRRHRLHAGTKFLVLLLFVAATTVTWQFARQQQVSSLPPSYAETTGFSTGEIQSEKPASASYAYGFMGRLRPGEQEEYA
jgi:hypothetical protein